jgi:hypothetical protein
MTMAVCARSCVFLCLSLSLSSPPPLSLSLSSVITFQHNCPRETKPLPLFFFSTDVIIVPPSGGDIAVTLQTYIQEALDSNLSV